MGLCRFGVDEMSVIGETPDIVSKALLLEPSKPAILNPWARYAGGFLIGRVYNHPLLSDGKIIVTSLVLELDEPAGYAKTINTHYKLVNKSSVAAIKRLRRDMRKQ